MNNRQCPQRKSPRLQGYDYSQQGAYFVTICTHKWEHLFGDVVNGKMILNDYGTIVQEEWLKTPAIRKEIESDLFVVMPNHFHAIVLIIKDTPQKTILPPRSYNSTRPDVGTHG